MLSNPPDFDMTLRVGCHLNYTASGPATLLLNVQPLPGPQHQTIEETFSAASVKDLKNYIDDHGNKIYRLPLEYGPNIIHHDAIITTTSQLDNHSFIEQPLLTINDLPHQLLRYILPSRYCDSDRLTNFAWEKFGHIEHGLPRVNAISDWIHRNIEYSFSSGRPDLSAGDVLQRGYGVCRDFAHLTIALNRTFNLPARYVTGHLPDIGFPEPNGHMDFHAYAEIYLGNQWYVSDARFNQPRIGRIRVACGLDAVDGAFSTIFGGATLSHFEIWAYQVAKDSTRVGDPIDLSQRLDNQWTVQTDKGDNLAANDERGN